MANQPPDVLTQFAMPDPNEAPLNLIQLFSLANRLVSSEIQGPYLSYLIQVNEPGTSDQDKIWLKLDSQQRPISFMYYYNGSWRRVYNGMLGEVRGYTGNPSNDFILTGTDPGLGKEQGNYDGWRLCNGKGGTPDLSDKFLIAAHMNNNDHPGYDNGWVTWVDNKTGKKTGGVTDFTLEEKNTYRKPTEAVYVGEWAAADNARSNTGQLYGVFRHLGGPGSPPDPNAVDNTLLIPADLGKTATTDPPIEAVTIIPPFYALAWITFVGYSS